MTLWDTPYGPASSVASPDDNETVSLARRQRLIAQKKGVPMYPYHFTLTGPAGDVQGVVVFHQGSQESLELAKLLHYDCTVVPVPIQYDWRQMN